MKMKINPNTFFDFCRSSRAMAKSNYEAEADKHNFNQASAYYEEFLVWDYLLQAEAEPEEFDFMELADD